MFSFGPNTPIVLLGTTILGVAGGVVGTFMLLRKRSLMGDVISHSALPGIVIAFILLEIWHPGSGKSWWWLLAGAVVTGLLGMLAVVALRRFPRIKEDAAMGIVLGVFFGFGAALLSVVQRMKTGSVAGLPHFIYGNTAVLVVSDVWMIAGACLLVLCVCGLLLKEFSLVAFDEQFAGAQGWPVQFLDVALMGLVVAVTVVGLQSVGLLLIVAILIIPAVAARFWTDHLPTMTLAAAVLGGVSAAIGTLVSSNSKAPAGAIIVLAAAAFFAISLAIGTRRGLLRRLASEWQMRRRIAQHHLLRAIFEITEAHGGPGATVLGEPGASAPGGIAGSVRVPNSEGIPSAKPSSADSHPRLAAGASVSMNQLQSTRSWTAAELTRLLHRSQREGLVEPIDGTRWRLTTRGAQEAARVVRNHRLWELYLIHHADVAATHVDRDADMIEHVLRPELIRELEELLSRQYPAGAIPPSPHVIN
ncbi:MAG: metal ABC transporter permease [Planctomycetes bacterium]|nr:metal ABC transporter permease [Planctomycetota bacterium]